MHSLGDVWHPGSGVPCFGGFAAFAAFGGSQSHFLPCFGSFAAPPTPPRGRAPEKQGYCEFGGFPVSQVWEPLGAHSLTFFPILPYLNAFLRWRFASWPWGSLFRRFCRFCSLGGLTVSLFPWGSLFRKFCRFCNLWGLAFGGSQSSLFFPILMHSLGDVWHPGPGVPCFGGFASFAAFGGSQSHFLPYSSLS